MEKIPFLFIFLVVFSVSLHAEPRLAAREGVTCNLCHINPTGAGQRNLFGVSYAENQLPYWKDFPDVSSLDSQLNPNISIGSDLKFRWTHSESGDATFTDYQGDLYLTVDLARHLAFHLENDFFSGTQEIFGLISDLPLGFYAKFGRFTLPYGLRIPDDSSFVRGSLGFAFSLPDDGVEVGLNQGPWFWNASLTNGTFAGNDQNDAKAFTVKGGFVKRRLWIGGSFFRNPTPTVTSTRYGLFGALSYWDGTLLWEIDRGEDEEEGSIAQIDASLVELHWLLRQGINLKVKYDFLDPDRDIADDDLRRYSAGFEFFPVRFSRFELKYRWNEESPNQDNNELFSELHLFF
ncbi:MAG: hypothetical protein HY538_09260 [Deltaproteobacteria bacterium]|nr:hypothetical protein [Deltaproteobacteria bacterium]